ncbi:MAG TPA: hydroxyacid dehydrogenase [Thermoplasmata archaeon]|nr:hydroxyacid dehydrogenase [Thermoplasmata archaeon]
MKVLVTDGLEPAAVKALQAHHEVLVEEVAAEGLPAALHGVHALIVRSRTKVTKSVIEAGIGLRVIARAGVGVDNIDVDAATARRIPVVNAGAASVNAVAELTLGHMLSLARHLPEAHETTRAGKWEKKRLEGTELHEKVLGLLGSGRIGAEVGRLAQAFGMRTIAFDPYLPAEVAKQRGIELVDYATLLEQSDYLSVHAALTAETRHMLGAKQLAAMKRTAYVVNCARGEIVDEAALAEALKAGTIAGAAVDVFSKEPPAGNPLIAAPNIHFTPHLGASTAEAQERVGENIADEVLRVLRGEKPQFCVNPMALA